MARRTPRKGSQVAVRNGDTGRTSMLTERTEDAIIHAVLEGNHIGTAAAAAGVSRAAIYRWLGQADIVEDAIEAGEPYDEGALGYLRFRDKLADARAQAEMRAVQVVQTSMLGGHVIEETPLLDLDGQPVRDNNGEILYSRKFTAPDGRLALTYLARSRPGDWGQNAQQRVELVGDGGGPVKVEHSADEIGGLAERLAAVAAERRAEREAEEAGPSDIVDVEYTEDGG